MNHTQKGEPKIVERLTVPITSLRPVTLIVTELAVIQPTDDGLLLKEIAPTTTLDTVCAATGTRLIVPEHVPAMNL